MMVMLIPTTNPVVMCSIRELNASQQIHVHQLFNRAVDCCPAYTRLGLPQLLPEILNSEIRATAGEFDQPLRNELARTSVTLAHLVESRVNFISYHHQFLLYAIY